VAPRFRATSAPRSRQTYYENLERWNRGHPRTAGQHIHPGHFSLKIPGLLSAEIKM